MKKSGILNAELSGIVAAMGHGQMLVVGDAGLPVPPGVPCVDLAVSLGVPRFWDVLDAVMTEMEIERAVIANEAGASVVDAFDKRLSTETTSHDRLKEMSKSAAAIVRTGETVPYTNVILVSGVPF